MTRLLLVVMLAMTVAGCAQKPTASKATASKPAVTKTTSGFGAPIRVRIASISGIGTPAEKRVRRELGAALVAAGLSVTPDTRAMTHDLKASFGTLNETNATSLTYAYAIEPKGGGETIDVTGFERIPGSSSDPWRNSGKALKRLVGKSANRVAARLRD